MIEHLAAIAGPGDRRQPRPALLRLRDRRRAAGRAGRRLAHLARGTRTRSAASARPPRRRSRRSSSAGCWRRSACRPRPPSASRPARRWRTSRASPPPATPCSSAPAGTSRPTGCGRAADPRARRRAGPRVAARARCATRASGRRAERVPADDQGAMRADALREALDDRPDDRLRPGRRGQHRRDRPARTRSPTRRASTAPGCTSTARSACGPPPVPRSATSSSGAERADSWAVDAHKWLNVPYDGAVAIVADRAAVRAAIGITASYLLADEGPRPRSTTRPRCRAAPARSRSTRRCASSAATALAELVDRCCALARRLAAAMEELDGAEVLNDVVAQPGAACASATTTSGRGPSIDGVQRGGEAWLGGTVWRGRAAAAGLGLQLVDHRGRHRPPRGGARS